LYFGTTDFVGIARRVGLCGIRVERQGASAQRNHLAADEMVNVDVATKSTVPPASCPRAESAINARPASPPPG
jgi:hypothetical protein